MMDPDAELPRGDQVLFAVVDEQRVRGLDLRDAQRPLEEQRRGLPDAEPAGTEESLEDRAQPEALDPIDVERLRLVVERIEPNLARGARPGGKPDSRIEWTTLGEHCPGEGLAAE